ncbi:MAG: AAA family ATPase [Hyphomicrobiaceae bacterium]
MKIRALRLREVGCFSEALALEGLSGGLDVLAGPNETGKSTLFRALQTLFGESYKNDNKVLRDLVPYRGGTPLIEADIEIAGKAWRYRKQYGSGRMAELRSLDSGEVLRNADAEAHIAREVDLAGLGLVWVPQTTAHELVAPEAAGRDLVRAAIETEVAATASGGLSEIVRKAVAAELGELVTLKQQRPRNAFKAEIERVEQLERSLAEAEARAAATEAHLATLEALRGEQVAVSSPAAAAARLERQADLDRRLGEDERLGSDLELAAERGRHLEQQAAAAAHAHAGLEEAMAALATLDAEIVAVGKDLAALAAGLQQAEATASEALAARRSADARATDAASRLDRASRHAEGLRLAARLEAALDAETESVRQRAVLETAGVTEHLLTRIEAEAQSIAILEAQASAQAPTVEIHLEPDGAGKVAIDGARITVDQALRPTAPVTIAVPGVAQVRVTPSGGSASEELQADLAAHRETLTALLARAGVRGIEEARAQGAIRRTAETALREAAVRLAAVAPEGIEALRQAVAGHDLAAADPAGETLDALRQTLAQARAASAQAGLGADAAETARAAATTAHAVARARIEARQQQRLALAATLPPEPERAARLAALADAKAATRIAASEAADAVLVMSRRRLADEERQRLLVERQSLRAETVRTDQRSREIERESARLVGLIEAQAEAGLGPEIDRLQGELAEARRRKASLEADVAGLTLLDRLLAEVAAESTATYLGPVLARLGPPLKALLGADAASLSEGLGVGGIVRQGRTEAPERLSTGTREQIAVLVRLAFADILASAGRPLPVALDDALVYADDDRLAQMIGLIEAASRKHQVVLLTCRTRAMAEAGFTPLTLTPWRP